MQDKRISTNHPHLSTASSGMSCEEMSQAHHNQLALLCKREHIQTQKGKINLHSILDIREQVRHNAVEEFQIIHEELGYIHISDGSQSNQFLSKTNAIASTHHLLCSLHLCLGSVSSGYPQQR
jgi:hypothetical protein